MPHDCRHRPGHLGTTNSLIGVWRNGGAELVPNALGAVLTTSVVSLDRSSDMLVGAAARERLTSHPALTAAAFKRYMGTPRKIGLGEQSFRAEELASFVIRSLRADAEAYLGEPVEEAIITVPAYFSDAQRRATRMAGELASLKVERLLNEPTAAALAYGLSSAGADGSVLVFDLGGGTFDVSVLEMNDGVLEVRATAGDNFLGGEDFDEVIAAGFLLETGMQAPDPLNPDPNSLMFTARLKREAEAARRRLGSEASATMGLQKLEASTAQALLTADTFARLSESLLERLRRPIARAPADSRIRPEQLAHVVLAAGATRMRIIRREAARLFGRVARADPGRHVAVLDRIGAEDWLLDLRQAAKAPGVQVTALLLAPHAQALALLMNAGLDAAGRAEVRTRFDELMQHAVFVLIRFDGATLALLREAVEGPPLLGEASAPAPVAAVKVPGVALPIALPETKKWQTWLIAGVALVAITSAQIWWKSSGRDGRNSPQGVDTSLALSIAEPLVKKLDTAWLETRDEPGGIFVDWAPVMRMRRAIADVRFGVNIPEPNTALTLPAVDVPIGFLAPRSIEYITMRIRYKDGTWSEVRRYPVWEGQP